MSAIYRIQLSKKINIKLVENKHEIGRKERTVSIDKNNTTYKLAKYF